MTTEAVETPATTTRRRHMSRIDRAGQRFGRLAVLGYHDTRNGRARWSCLCDCGAVAIVPGGDLKDGNTTSCGCYKGDWSRQRFTRHGLSRTSIHRCWQSMKDRCENPNNQRYRDYGGRGIRVCDRWRDSFENFLSDMGPKLTPQHSLDRWPNNDGHYEPGNCRWATPMEQRANRRDSQRTS